MCAVTVGLKRSDKETLQDFATRTPKVSLAALIQGCVQQLDDGWYALPKAVPEASPEVRQWLETLAEDYERLVNSKQKASLGLKDNLIGFHKAMKKLQNALSKS